MTKLTMDSVWMPKPTKMLQKLTKSIIFDKIVQQFAAEEDCFFGIQVTGPSTTTMPLPSLCADF